MSSDTLTVALGDRTYDIFFSEDIYSLFQEWICRFYPGGSVFVVTDDNVSSIYGENIRQWLTGIPNNILSLPPGETFKRLETVAEIYAFLARGGAERDSLVVAFGGGVVGDLAGFAAATYLRGIPYIQVPTTLLAQVDSSVGGKTGFNLPSGKNLVGSFHQPRAVFIDHTFLRTLDERNLRAGMAEVVKCAIAGDAVLWETLRSSGSRWRSFTGPEWHEIIRRSVAFKASVVEKDERESSTRKVLNLGHTIGHALEQSTGYTSLLHGEAVAMGLAWEAIFARRLQITPPELEEGLFVLLRDMGFALDEPGLALSSIATAIGRDKKRIVSDVEMPMVTAPGTSILRRIPLSHLRRELPAIRAEIRQRGSEAVMDSDEERMLLERMDRGEAREVAAILAQRVASRPRGLRALVLLAEAYRRTGETAVAWETIKEALQQYPSDARAQRTAREIEQELLRSPGGGGGAPSIPLEEVVLLEGEAFEIRPADVPEAPAPSTPPVPEAEISLPLVELEPEAPTSAAVPSEAPEVSQAVSVTEEPVAPPIVEPEAEISLPLVELEPEAPTSAVVPPEAPEIPQAVSVTEEPALQPIVAAEPEAPLPPSAETPSPERTISMATVYWDQGEREAALQIVDEILRCNPGHARALEWKKTHATGELEDALTAFLAAIAKEYRYELSRPH